MLSGLSTTSGRYEHTEQKSEKGRHVLVSQGRRLLTLES